MSLHKKLFLSLLITKVRVAWNCYILTPFRNVFLFLESFNVLRRNLKNQHEGIHSLAQRLDNVERQQSAILEMCSVIKETVLSTHKNVQRDELNISGFFPLANGAMLDLFLSNDDGLFNRRASHLEDLLYTTFNPITNKSLTQSERSFTDALITTLFSPEFLMTHRWPTTTYVCLNLFNCLKKHYGILSFFPGTFTWKMVCLWSQMPSAACSKSSLDDWLARTSLITLLCLLISGPLGHAKCNRERRI